MHEPLTTQLLAELLGDLSVAFPARKNDVSLAQLANVYRNGLNGLSGDSVREAVRRSIQTDQYFPKVARLREHAQQYDRQRTVTVRGVGGLEWGVCTICHRRVELLPFYAPTLDAHGKPMYDEHHKPVMHVAGQREHLIHDARAHGIHQALEGAA